jgi:hypothetical protein
MSAYAKSLKSMVDVGRLELPTPCLQRLDAPKTKDLAGIRKDELE